MMQGVLSASKISVSTAIRECCYAKESLFLFLRENMRVYIQREVQGDSNHPINLVLLIHRAGIISDVAASILSSHSSNHNREGEVRLARMRKFDVGGSGRADSTTEMFWPISNHELRVCFSRVLHPQHFPFLECGV
jgi:hypothetical protein